MIGTVIKRGIVTALCASALLTNASAQNAADRRENEIIVGLDIGYNTAYRDRSWVPVDVTVRNELEDIEGWAEVRTYSGGQLQSPIYRLPVISAKNSRKRFRLHVYLDGTTRIEAWLYDGKRPAVEVPQYINLTPIDDEDLLGIILENDVGRFGFLYNVVRTDEANLRFHRHGLSSANLSLLPDYAECYEAFNVMVVGDIDPTRVTRRHRQLIGDYVREGGTLVICTGMNGGRYRGTWIEDLSGVKIGEPVDMTEAELADQVFPYSWLREGASERRDIVFTALEPAADGVRSFGDKLALATIRPLGRGRVYTLAVDATSEALQDCIGFQEIWREMALSASSRPRLNVGAAAAVTAQLLPSLSGITIQPLSTVTIYLCLYVGIGMLANWIFWSFMKRREMAWVCLVIFSLGFTGYAMAFGSAGWAKVAELQQIHIIQAPVAGSQADYESFAGILSPRTRTYSAKLERQNFLARDAGSMSAQSRGRMLAPGNRFTRGSGESSQPFYSIQGEDPGIARFRVGASELRMANIRGRIPMAGGVEGEVNYTNSQLTATFTNHTGLTFQKPTLFYDGTFFPLDTTPDGWSLNLGLGSVQRFSAVTNESVSYIQNGLQYGGFYGIQALTLDSVRENVQIALFMEESYAQAGTTKDGPPYVLGWVAESIVDGLGRSDNLDEGLSITLIVAEVDESPELTESLAFARELWKPLGVRVDNSYWTTASSKLEQAEIWRTMRSSARQRLGSDLRGPMWHTRRHNARGGPDTRVAIRAPSSKQKSLRIDLYWHIEETPGDLDGIDFELVGQPGGVRTVFNPTSKSFETRDGRKLNHWVFEIDEWDGLTSSLEPGTLSLTIQGRIPESGDSRSSNYVLFRYLVVASEYFPDDSEESGRNGEWLIWQ